MMPALILFAHGSRDPVWAQPFAEIHHRVQSMLPETPIELAFLEIMQPTMDQAVDRLIKNGNRRILIAPLFMAQGTHLRNDLTRILNTLKKSHADIEFRLLPAVGEAPTILDAISNWLVTSVTSSGVKPT